MNITIAGKQKEVADGISVAELIRREQVENPQYVTVAVNAEFLPGDIFERHTLQEGDSVEFLYFMGGGSHGALQ